VIPCGADGRIARIRYVLPRHKAANWVGRGRGRKFTRPGANGVVELPPFGFLDRLADLVPPPASGATPLLAGMGASVTAREAAAPRTKNPAHDDRDVFQGRIDELPVIDIHSL